MSSTWVRIGMNHTKITRWPVHGWEEVRTNKKIGTWIGTHLQLFSKHIHISSFFMSTIHKIIPVSIILLPPPPLTQLNSKKRREQKMFIMGSFHVTFVPPFHSMMKTTHQQLKRSRMLWNTPLWTTNTYYYHTWNHLHPALTRCVVYVAVYFAWLAGKHHVLQLSNISS